MLPPPRPIRPLSDQLINQIAAGEVVERPASIVKELLENSLDAGASAIRIDLRGGGIDYIAVEDDGHGIAQDQLVLALARHCTSKISQREDLDGILSLGFRGEALASISAVAEVTLTSRVADATHAWTLHSQPSRAPTTSPASRAIGTTITVRDLFATIPARRHFLRRATTELLTIQQLIRGIAFCVPGVGFTVNYEQRQWHAPAAKDERSNALRWRAIFGAEFAREARFVEISTTDLRLYGWLGPPALARGQSDLQFLAVNGRLIRDRQLAHGIRAAFGDSLATGRYAAFALHLEVAPHEVDVNVHPSKTEVRFRRLRDVHDLLYAATRQVLTQGPQPAPVEPVVYPTAPASLSVLRVAEDSRLAGDLYVPRDRGVAAGGPSPNPLPTGGELIGGQFLAVMEAGSTTIYDFLTLIRELINPARAPVASRVLTFPNRVPAPPGPGFGLDLAAYADYGFEFAAIGPTAWALRAVPAVLPELDGEALVRQLLCDPGFADAPLAAAARASASALRIPLEMPSRAAWIASWRERASSAGFELNRYQRTLDAVALTKIFASPPAR